MSQFALLNGDCLTLLKDLPDNSLDSLVTDPPAGISFMGKEWDDDKGGRKQWVAWMTEVMSECLRVLKPGAHGLVWALPRTSHWTATALEDAGFEVRDVVTHLFGTGFPKSMAVDKAIDAHFGKTHEREVLHDPQAARRNKAPRAMAPGEAPRKALASVTAPATDAAKEWQGWGTALKPASEHWILVRKPCSEKTVAANVLKWGVGGINIDECRVATNEVIASVKNKDIRNGALVASREKLDGSTYEQNTQGRFPANLVLDEEAAAALDEQSGILKSGNLSPHHKLKASENSSMSGPNQARSPRQEFGGDSGGASRFFYVAKASKSDKGDGNTHPTVKSTALMSYLITLVTPPNGLVLDPFSGSGTTGVSAMLKGFDFLGFEQSPEYFEIANARLTEVEHMVNRTAELDSGKA